MSSLHKKPLSIVIPLLTSLNQVPLSRVQPLVATLPLLQVVRSATRTPLPLRALHYDTILSHNVVSPNNILFFATSLPHPSITVFFLNMEYPPPPEE
ncbi:DNA-binding protein, partial [Sesbania bispinosa]